MSRRGWNIIGILILMGITSLVSVLAYIYIIGGSGEASAPISAPTLSLTDESAAGQIARLSTEVALLQNGNATLSAMVGEDNLAPPTLTPEGTEETTVEAAAVSSEPILFRIVPEESEARFSLMEDLNGQPNLVVGRTNQVAGDIVVDLGAPGSSRVGTIRINARTFVTDSEFRNRAIRAEILESSQDQYEFIEFTPTALTGLPDSIAAGDAISFQLTGDLKIRDTVQTVTFNVTATLISADRLQGTGTAVVTRDQYSLTIPSVPSVANVANDVTLEIDFVATRVEE
jgi:hypothetical protein